MPHNLERSKATNFKRLFVNKVEVTATAADLNLISGAVAAGQGVKKVAKVALAAVDTAGGFFSWQNPEGAAILINRLTLDVTTAATGSCTVDCGTSATNGTTSSDNLIDGLNVNSATGVFDNVSAPGSNGKGLQRLAAGKWVNGSKASGATAGIVGSAFIEYFVIG